MSDPCSIGVAAELIGVTDEAYAKATVRQAESVLEKAPRWSNGAISHRYDVTELWADNSMSSPPSSSLSPSYEKPSFTKLMLPKYTCFPHS